MAAANTKKHKHTKKQEKHTYNYERKKEKDEKTTKQAKNLNITLNSWNELQLCIMYCNYSPF